MCRSSFPVISPFTCRLAPRRAEARSGVVVSGRIASVLMAVPSKDVETGFGGIVPGGLGRAVCGVSAFLFHMAPSSDQRHGQSDSGTRLGRPTISPCRAIRASEKSLEVYL